MIRIGIAFAALTMLMPQLAQADAAANALVHQALGVQGGEAKLRAIKSVQWEASGYRNQIEESERPQGPYILELTDTSEIHDYAGNRYRSVTQSRVYPAYKFSQGTVVNGDVAMQLFGDRKAPGTPEAVKIAHEREALSPERLLLTATDAPDLRRDPDTVLQSVPQNVLRFTLDGAPVRIFLNAYTHLPTAVDYAGPSSRTGFWSYLGDVTLRTYYSTWWLAKGGIHLPMQFNIEGAGYPDRMLTISKLQIDEALPDADLAIPDDVRAKFDPNAPPASHDTTPLGIPGQPAREPAPGIVFIPGSWNATIIRQDDGIVILEAPISSGYAAKVIAEAKGRFPGARIKAVITTSDSWPHIAGIREYVADGVPIYALDLNKPILERMIGWPHTTQPDALQTHPRKPYFHLISGKTELGTGANHLEIIPIRGETSERQMMVYFPQHHLLYGSDPFQRDGSGVYTFPQTVTELTDAVAREHLQVDTFFMMHIAPTPWTDLAKAIADAETKDTPDGNY